MICSAASDRASSNASRNDRFQRSRQPLGQRLGLGASCRGGDSEFMPDGVYIRLQIHDVMVTSY